MSERRFLACLHLLWCATLLGAAWCLGRAYTNGQAILSTAGRQTVQAQVDATREMNREVLQKLRREGDNEN